MSVGLKVPSLELCIKLCLLIILVSGILTRSKKILLIGLSFLLFCCLYALTRFIFKKFKPEFGSHEVVEESEDTQETGQVSPCPQESMKPSN